MISKVFSALNDSVILSFCTTSCIVLGLVVGAWPVYRRREAVPFLATQEETIAMMQWKLLVSQSSWPEGLQTKESVEHTWIKLLHTQHGFGPVLCCTNPFPPQKNLSLIVKEEAAGSSPSIPAITPPVRPFLYLQMQQGVLMWTSFLFDRRNDEWIFFHARKSYNSLNNQNEVALSADRVCMVQYTCTGSPFKTSQLKAPSINRM